MTASVLLLAALLILPLLTYLCAKLAGYGWEKGKWKALQELYRRSTQHGDEERP